MARYTSEAEAAADGFSIVHEPEQHRFAVYRRSGDIERLVGEAHYSLTEATAGIAGSIDFDHTVVRPEYRGTGVSGLLAHRAVTDDVVRDRRVLASCWFIEGYLARHPELLTDR
ncbi:GNAT family N-acetyltransferase [Leucobacter luti]|uniref:GNAT family N-acetyltransferase n=1 Tax=Leucobacter luti TaxID=340320 RepID=UPI001053F275|nr:GNAT family N-acetyltransferase [Leucobacter luti]MCW2287445.1 putative GNAT family acetyltransferase [Leucobacter luti]